MKKKILPVLLCAAVAILLAVTVWQGVRLSALERTLEETYRSALCEAAEEMQSLSVSLEKALVSSDPGQTARLLCAISRQAAQVQRSLALLPLSHRAMADTLAFANRLSDYAASLLPSAVASGALGDDALAALQTHLAACARLGGQLALSRQAVESRQLRLSQPEAVFAADAASQQRPLEILGEKDGGMNYPTLIYDGPFSDGHASGAPRGLPAGEVTQAQALDIARRFVGEGRALSVSPAPDTGGKIAAWGVTIQTADLQLNLEITRQGGKVLLMAPETASFPVTQSVQTCRDAAARFLDEQGFGTMEATHHQLYDGLCVISFAALQSGVVLYPDLVKVQLRMDTAEVVGLEAHNYWVNHVSRSLPEPVLTREEAQALLSDRVAVRASRLCLVPGNDSEVLCYEFSVTLGDGEYYIYLAADDGREVELLKVIPSENGTLTA